MATEFRISEVPSAGMDGGGGANSQQFVWTADKKASVPALGGARACPREAMEIGGRQTMVRTKNPGAVYPNFQVLGPDREPIALHGVWDDRYNFKGYAVFEMRRFEDMCRRGNNVRVSVDAQGFVGKLSDWKFTYRRAWDIGYTFTLSVHSRDDGENTPAMPNDVQDPVTITAKLNQQGDYVAATHARRPESSIYGKVMSGIRSGLGAVADGLAWMTNMLSTKTGALKPLGDLKAIATQLRSLQGNCSTVLNQLVTAKATTDMTCRTARAVVDYEAWSKSMASQLRLLRQKSRQGAVACDQRVQPATMSTYRPRKGQSLYSVSMDVYGTPFEWRGLYSANHLTTTIMDGTRTLIVPARGAA